MAIFEVTITGNSASPCYDEDDKQNGYAYYEEEFCFVREGSGLIETMMEAQALVDKLNEALQKKCPEAFRDDRDWEFKITGIRKTELIRFTDVWIKEYLESGIITRNYEDQDD